MTEMPGSRMRTAARVIRHQSDRQPPHTLSIQTSCDESRSHRRAVQARVDQPCCSSCATSASADCGSFFGPRPASLEDSLPQSPYMPLVEAPVDGVPVQACPPVRSRRCQRRHRERCCHHLCPTCPSVPVLTAVNFRADRGRGCSRKSPAALQLRNVWTVVAEPQLLWLDRRARDKLSRRQDRSSCNGGRSSL